MVDTTLLWLERGHPAGAPRARSSTRAGAEHAGTKAQPQVRASRRAPSLECHRSGGSRGCGPRQAGGGGIRAPKRCRGPALQDGPKFFKKVPDDVMLHPEVRQRLVCLLAKGQQFALIPLSRAGAAHRDVKRTRTQLCFDGVKAGVRCAGYDLARRNGQRGANGLGFSGTIGPGYDRAASAPDSQSRSVPHRRSLPILARSPSMRRSRSARGSNGIEPSTRLSVRL